MITTAEAYEGVAAQLEAVKHGKSVEVVWNELRRISQEAKQIGLDITVISISDLRAIKVKAEAQLAEIERRLDFESESYESSDGSDGGDNEVVDDDYQSSY